MSKRKTAQEIDDLMALRRAKQLLVETLKELRGANVFFNRQLSDDIKKFLEVQS